MLFEQYHLRRLDEAFMLVTARSGTSSTPRSPGSAQVIVVYSLGPSCASILASAPDKALPQPTRWAALTRARRAFPATKTTPQARYWGIEGIGIGTRTRNRPMTRRARSASSGPTSDKFHAAAPTVCLKPHWLTHFASRMMPRLPRCPRRHGVSPRASPTPGPN